MSKNKKVNFNDEDSIQNIIHEIASDKSKNKNGKAPFPQRVIAFFTKNISITAVIAIYFIVCGILSNIFFVIRNPVLSLVIASLLIISVFVVLKIDKRKI